MTDATKRAGGVKRTCCRCIEIRRGVLLLLGLKMILCIIVFGVEGNKARSGGAGSTDVALAIAIAHALWAVFGFYTALKRKTGAYRVFVYIYTFLLIGDLVAAILTISVASIVQLVISVYIAYIYYKYIATMEAELTEGSKRDQPSA